MVNHLVPEGDFFFFVSCQQVKFCWVKRRCLAASIALRDCIGFTLYSFTHFLYLWDPTLNTNKLVRNLDILTILVFVRPVILICKILFDSYFFKKELYFMHIWVCACVRMPDPPGSGVTDNCKLLLWVLLGIGPGFFKRTTGTLNLAEPSLQP